MNSSAMLECERRYWWLQLDEEDSFSGLLVIDLATLDSQVHRICEALHHWVKNQRKLGFEIDPISWAEGFIQIIHDFSAPEEHEGSFVETSKTSPDEEIFRRMSKISPDFPLFRRSVCTLEAESLTQAFRFVKRSDRSEIVVVFAPANINVPVEFSSAIPSCSNILYVRDPEWCWYLKIPLHAHGRTQYHLWEGYSYFESILERFVQGFDSRIFIGDSMGGSAALLFSHMATKVHAFVPQLELDSWFTKKIDGISKRRREIIPEEKRRMFALKIRENMRIVGDCCYIIHFTKFPGDASQKEVLRSINAQNCSIIDHDIETHGLYDHLLQEGNLQEILDLPDHEECLL